MKRNIPFYVTTLKLYQYVLIPVVNWNIFNLLFPYNHMMLFTTVGTLPLLTSEAYPFCIEL